MGGGASTAQSMGNPNEVRCMLAPSGNATGIDIDIDIDTDIDIGIGIGFGNTQ